MKTSSLHPILMAGIVLVSATFNFTPVLAAVISTSVSTTTSADSFNLTTLGTQDWVEYNTWVSDGDGNYPGGPLGSPTYNNGALLGNEMMGGSGIGNLFTITGYPGTNTGGPTVSWTNGTPTTSGSTPNTLVGFQWTLNGTATAATTSSTLDLFFAMSYGDVTVGLTLAGATPVNVTVPFDFGGDAYQYAHLKVDFTGDTAGDQLAFTINGGNNYGLTAATLSGVPEPSTVALSVGALGVLIVMRKRKVAAR